MCIKTREIQLYTTGEEISKSGLKTRSYLETLSKHNEYIRKFVKTKDPKRNH